VNLRRVLVDAYEWEPAIADEYLDVILDIADASGGGIVAPQTPVSDCTDHEDNRILECALASGALMIVSNDSDLLSMSPWRGTPIVTAEEFATRTDAMRR
jgi:predicted nucleic acid-binding protein